MNNVRTFPACKADLCRQGRHPCPTPQACQVPETDPAPTRMPQPGAHLLPWLTLQRFWIGSALGIVSALLVPHLWARF